MFRLMFNQKSLARVMQQQWRGRGPRLTATEIQRNMLRGKYRGHD